MRVYLKVRIARIKLFCRKAHRKAKRIALAVVIMEFILAGSYAIAEYNGFMAILEPKTVIIEVVKPAEAKETKQKEPINKENAEIGVIADKIWQLESSKDKNNYSKCEAIGKYNEYGYNIPGNGVYSCYEKGEDRAVVIKWIKDKMSKGFSEEEILCYYNTGKKTDNCNYAVKASNL